MPEQRINGARNTSNATRTKKREESAENSYLKYKNMKRNL